MRITRVMLQGFLSYANRQTIDMSNLNLCAVTGVNGSGKSSLFQSITWCLYGEGRFRGGDKDSVINDYSDMALVQVDLIDNQGKMWRIERSRPRGGTTSLGLWWHNDENPDDPWVREDDGRIKNAQAEVYRVVGFDEHAFYSLAYVNGSGGSRFIQADSDDRRSILMGLLPSMNLWSVLSNVTASAAQASRSELRTLENRHAVHVDAEDETQATLESLNERIAKARDPQDIKDDIASAESLIADLEDRLSSDNDGRAKSAEKLDAMRARRELANSQIKSKIAETKAEIARVANLEKEYDLSADALEELTSVIKENKKRLAELDETFDQDQESDEKIVQEAKREIRELEDTLSSGRERKRAITLELSELKERHELLDSQVESGDVTCFVCESPLSDDKAHDLIHQVDDRVRKLRDEREALTAAEDGHRRRISRLESEKVEASDRIAQRASDVQKLERLIESKSESRKALRSELKDAERVLDDSPEVEELEKRRDDLRNQLLDVSEEEQDLQDRISKMDRESTDGRQLKDAQARLRGFQREHEDLITLRSRIQTHEDQFEKQRQQIEESLDAIDNAKVRLADDEYINKACSPRGLPNMLLSDVLTSLQNIQNEMLASLYGSEPISVEYRQQKENKTNDNVKDVLDIVVHMPNGAERPIESCSSGEIIRVTLTNLLALVHYFNQQNGNLIRNIFLDESLGVVDKTVVPILLETLRNAVAQGVVDSVIVIAHDQAVIDSLPQTITVQQVKDEAANLTSQIEVNA